MFVELIVEEKPKEFSVNHRDEAFQVRRTCKIRKGK
jgi:hypothetical protein